MPVILATWEAKIRRIIVQGQPRQKVHKTSSQPIKAGRGDMHLSSQLHETCKQGSCGPGWPGHKREILYGKKN
jgi:hypothetical protein